MSKTDPVTLLTELDKHIQSLKLLKLVNADDEQTLKDIQQRKSIYKSNIRRICDVIAQNKEVIIQSLKLEVRKERSAFNAVALIEDLDKQVRSLETLKSVNADDERTLENIQELRRTCRRNIRKIFDTIAQNKDMVVQSLRFEMQKDKLNRSLEL